MAKGLLDSALKGVDWQTALDPKQAVETLPHLKSGSIVIDQLIGGRKNVFGVRPCPGYPKGKIIQVYGWESSGKTTLALEAAAATIQQGGCVCYIDWEHEVVPGYAKALGVPIGDQAKFMLSQPDTFEDGAAVAWTMASAGVDLLIFDSVGAAVPRAQFEKSIQETGDQARVGGNAAAWSQFLPKLKNRTAKTGTVVIGISQLRDSISTTRSYGDNKTVQGGKAWKYYPAVRIMLQNMGAEKAKDYSALANAREDRVVGAKIRARLEKCKVSDQHGNTADFYIRWGQGIDDIRSLIEIGVVHRCVVKTGNATYRWTDPAGQVHERVGIDKFRSLFVDNRELEEQLARQVLPYLCSSGSGEVVVSEDADDEDEDGEVEEDGEVTMPDTSEIDALIAAIEQGSHAS